MATTKNITMKQFNGTDYDTLYPKTVAAQIDDVYSKSETYSKNDVYTKSQVYDKTQTLADATKTMYGLGSTATPNDALAYLGQYNQYWWRRCGYTPAKFWFNKSGLSYEFGIQRQDETTYFYNVSVDIDGDLTISLTGETYRYVWGQTSALPQASLFKGKYFSNINTITSTANIDSLFYGTDAVSIKSSTTSLDKDCYVVTNCQRDIRSLSAIPTYSYEYLKSNNSNAYPVGFSGNYYYEKIGQPLVNLPYYSQIATGSYEGTGGRGENNPNILTFNFVPKFLFVTTSRGFQLYTYSQSSHVLYDNLIWQEGVTNVEVFTDEVTVLRNNKTIQWYSNSTISQLNETHEKYYYVAFG